MEPSLPEGLSSPNFALSSSSSSSSPATARFSSPSSPTTPQPRDGAGTSVSPVSRSPPLSTGSSSRASPVLSPPSRSLSTPSVSPLRQPTRSLSQLGRSRLNAASTGSPASGASHGPAGAGASPSRSASISEPEEPEEELSFEELQEKAKCGDASAQSRMGRYFLAMAEERDEELNSCRAVTWLIQAAKQGRKDAVKQLQRCLGSRKGTEHCFVRDARFMVDTRLFGDEYK
ncbi:hypothetical protein NHX12_010777 [Muraenolepis orangiensis]|uniref:Sel1 repeat-containing protein n=1 Tax=Muraenolepis orangiensis TaxID=630683 RepID=A0A9Q0DE03_9TELE|nr:hypothetical protein NHX12_010777 [Muraenolepis orangiensis]